MCSVQAQTLSQQEIEQLISKMSIEEKIGQMTQINLDVVCEGEIYKLVEPHHTDPAKLKIAFEKYHVGSVLNCGGHAYTREQWNKLINDIHQANKQYNTHGIPVLYGVDAIHGANYVLGSTLFPQPLAQAATFNVSLARKGASITAYETRAAGIPWNFSPVLDCGRNKAWSRFFETYGEDPYVCSEFGKAVIIGYQGSYNGTADEYHVAACMKHFVGYSNSRTGWDRTPIVLSQAELHGIYLPPFKAAVDAGALTVMLNSSDVNGVPVHANSYLIQEVLRKELGFEGIIVTDWEDVSKLITSHHIAATYKEAVEKCVKAGIDMCMVPNNFEFADALLALVKEGKISEARINESVRRILTVKNQVNLFVKDNTVNAANYPEFGSVAFQAEALATAEEAITLLKNNNQLLPLNSQQKIAVVGPAANSMTLLNGAWTRTWQGTDTTFDAHERNTIYEALRTEFQHATYWKGCELEQYNRNESKLNELKKSDVIVLCLGELPSTEIPGNINDLSLSRAQLDFAKDILKLGVPVVLVLVEDRPRLVREIVDECQAVVMAYEPGDFGGDALAHILVGKVNPSGKLPFTYPKYMLGTQTYDHTYSEEIDTQFGNKAFNPEWPFGFGLSYSNVSYSDLQVVGNKVTVKITNPSDRDAKESVLVYVSDEVASTPPAVKRLKAFKKVYVPAKRTVTIELELTDEAFQFVNAEGKAVFEPGSFIIRVGNLEQKIERIR